MNRRRSRCKPLERDLIIRRSLLEISRLWRDLGQGRQTFEKETRPVARCQTTRHRGEFQRDEPSKGFNRNGLGKPKKWEQPARKRHDNFAKRCKPPEMN